jgi:hypothetical protein
LDHADHGEETRIGEEVDVDGDEFETTERIPAIIAMAKIGPGMGEHENVERLEQPVVHRL